MGPKVNSKVAAANARKAAAEMEKEAAAQKQREKEDAASWEVGSDMRGKNKKAQADQKADEQLRKKQEMAELLAAEEANMAGSVFKKPKPVKKKGKDDLDKLNEALAGAPKTKAQKLAEEKKKAAELKRKKEEAARAKREEEKRKREADALKAGVVLDHGDSLLVENTNKQDSDVIEASSITDALSALSTAPGPEDDPHPEKRQKALHKAYVEKMMPVVKQEHPGLRMTQYQEKIFEMWKTSPENPRYVASIKAREEQKKATLI